ncbi:MAG TPA: molybdopterin molybdenumtransferase MoeA, partial [Acidimicrobiia bacterium]|nr:molybdopterin molybdenumtransferase MoeA [Acidimicrobiia bacterium]
MKPLGEAQRQVLAALPLLPVVAVPLEEAAGLVLAQRVVAPHAIPPFANSAVDGFAVRAADTDSVPVDLAVAEDVPAGRSPRKSVTEGIAIRIMTGAPIP